LAALGALVPVLIVARKNSLLLKAACSGIFLAMGIVACWQRPDSLRLWALAAMVLGLVGDILLHISRDAPYFISGTAAFLLGHVAYVLSFTHALPLSPAVVLSAILLTGAVTLVGWRLKVHPGKMLPLVLGYMLVISLMVSSAWALAIWKKCWLLLAGGALFLVSDMVLAYSRFKKPVPNSAAWCLGTYYMGQGLLALSLLFLP